MSLLFSTLPYEGMKADLLATGHFTDGQIERKTFPDGEQYTRLLTSVEGETVILVGGTIDDANTMEIYDLACAIVKYGARSLTLVIPYYGYATMERAAKSGEVVKAKTRARLLSSIPSAGVGNRVILVDLHSEGIPHYFEGNMRPIHLYAKPVILSAIRRLGGEGFVLGGVDAGRAKWVESLARDLGVQPAFAYKQRLSDRETLLTAVNADVKGKAVVIYDDMIRTGGSLIQAARAYRDAGALDISVVVTHGLFCEDSLIRLRESGFFRQIVCTDTHPRVRQLAGDFLSIEAIAPITIDSLTEKL